MSSAHSDDRADELTERYRAASAVDPAQPSDKVRESILTYARTVAANQAARGRPRARRYRPAANSSWRLSAAAGVIVAGFTTLLAWHLYAPTPTPQQERNLPQQLAAPTPPPIRSTVPAEPSIPSHVDRYASAAPRPNAVTSRSRERAAPPAEPAARAPEAAADLATEAGSLASARQAPARLAGNLAAKNAPPDVQAHQSDADAAASARASAAPSPPLVTAAASGNIELIDQLLHGGIGTEATDARGRTALLIATLRGDIPMVRRLLDAGARAEAADDAGDTPLAAARRQGPPELAQLLEHASHP